MTMTEEAQIALNELKALFPVKGTITKEILEEANIGDIYNCIGALTLKAALSLNYEDAHWGRTAGFIIHNKEGVYMEVTTEEGFDFMTITEPQEVTFILESRQCF